MLPEKIYYPHDFPLTITIAELNEVPLHYHLDVELVVVLQGSITLKSGSCQRGASSPITDVKSTDSGKPTIPRAPLP